jgi:zinc and cadmium transporter
MTAFLLSLLAALAALGGGFLAIRGRKQLSYTLGFTAGVILGLVAFDLLPEIFNITQKTGLDTKWPMITLVIGFLAFHIIEKFILIHYSQENNYEPHVHPHVGLASALALAGHSFLDGVAIGVGFQVNRAVGTAVAIAVISHRFADGFNTTNVMLHHQNKPNRARRLLYIAAIMPVLGVLLTDVVTFSERSLAVYLGFFAGFLLYIGASDILPQAHSKGSSRKTIGLTVLGTIFMFVVTRFI